MLPCLVCMPTVASLLKKLKTAPNDAKEFLGHARIATTMEVYTRGDEDDGGVRNPV